MRRREKIDVPLLGAAIVCFIIAAASLALGLLIGEWRNGW